MFVIVESTVVTVGGSGKNRWWVYSDRLQEKAYTLIFKSNYIYYNATTSLMTDCF